MRKVRDAKIQNSRRLRQERLDHKEPEQDLGACGSYGERLYDEGTELCELNDTCFANYKLWRKEQ